MQDVDEQGMFSAFFKKRQAEPVKPTRHFPAGDNIAQPYAEEVHKNPRQNRKVVGRREVRAAKAERPAGIKDKLAGDTKRAQPRLHRL